MLRMYFVSNFLPPELRRLCWNRICAAIHASKEYFKPSTKPAALFGLDFPIERNRLVAGSLKKILNSNSDEFLRTGAWLECDKIRFSPGWTTHMAPVSQSVSAQTQLPSSSEFVWLRWLIGLKPCGKVTRRRKRNWITNVDPGLDRLRPRWALSEAKSGNLNFNVEKLGSHLGDNDDDDNNAVSSSLRCLALAAACGPRSRGNRKWF